MSKIFVTRPIPEVGINFLISRGHEVAINIGAKDRPATKPELINGAKNADAILAILTDKIDAEVMDAGAPTLKIIANFAVGYDNIDVAAAKQRNIFITNTPGVLTETVAEHTFGLLMAITRRIPEAERFARAGKFTAWGPQLMLGSDMAGKTLGIVGLGRIGSRVAHYAIRGFEMKVIYTDTKQNPEFEKEYGASFAPSIDEILSLADYISLNVPLNDSTRHLMNEQRFSMMKRSAYLINTSRGPVIDEAALAHALQNGIIKGAAIDVFEFEPKISPELLELENIVITPHTASASEETRNKMSEMAAANIAEVLEGRAPINPVN
jgi:glyoxylate reductase